MSVHAVAHGVLTVEPGWSIEVVGVIVRSWILLHTLIVLMSMGLLLRVELRSRGE